MLKRAQIVLAFAAAAPAVAQKGGARCLRSEPDTVALTGVLRRHTYPGAPNYESVANGDAPETGYYLHLLTPVCTAPEAEPDDAQVGIRVLQLVLDSAGYARLRSRLGSRVSLRGTLFASFTGHHHAPLLLTPLPPYGPPRAPVPDLAVGCRDTTAPGFEACLRVSARVEDSVRVLEETALGTLTGVARSRFENGTVAWRNWRENSCRGESAMWSPGSAAELRGESCRTRLTRERLRYLVRLLAETPGR
jgi:hypothetical protein